MTMIPGDQPIRRKSKYSEEYKKNAVRLFLSRGERTVEEVAESLGVASSMLYRWKNKYDPASQLAEPEGWPEDATCDDLIGTWSIYQRENGHKTSTDDVLTACLAFRCMEAKKPGRYLDLGCGIGSVLLMTCHALKPSYSLGIEAQKQSAAMAKASIDRLPEAEQIAVIEADFREAIDESLEHSFDLVTGSPPYFPLGSGTLSQDYQRLACRFELRGGVEAYCQTAEQAMNETAKFVLVFQTEWADRVLCAADAVNLHLQQRTDVLMRVDRDRPFLSIFVFGRSPTQIQTMGFAIRNERGEITPEYRKARSELGLRTRS